MSIEDYEAYDRRKKEDIERDPWTWMKDGRVPKRFLDCKASLGDFGNLRFPAEACNTFAFGSVGTGKTHLAVGLLARWLPGLEKGFTSTLFKWYYWADLAFSLVTRETFDLQLHVPLMVLDDIARPGRQDQLLRLRQIINYRWERDLPTIVTSNLTLTTWHNIDPRISSRLSDGIVVRLEGKDRRPGKGQLIVVKGKDK